MGIEKDLSGKTFGQWTVLSKVGKNKYGMGKWFCRCSCGKEKIVLQGGLVSGKSISCGCSPNTRKTKHGFLSDGQYPKEYSSWRNMINRCYDTNHDSYKRYGAVGIIVCDRWRYSFKNFIEDMGLMPSDKHSIDRYPNKKGNYEPNNCRWATQVEQCSNLEKNVLTEFQGIIITSAEFRRITGIKSRWVTTLLKTKSAQEVYDLYKIKNKI